MTSRVNHIRRGIFMKKITILALSWRDIRSPKAGGAEVHTHEMLSLPIKRNIRYTTFRHEMRDKQNMRRLMG